MRTPLAILALVFGCVGCPQKQTASQRVAVPAPEPGERPSFYHSNNVAKHYGRCPKCQHWVNGYRSNMTYADQKTGMLVGCDSSVKGTCQYCRVFLFADESGSPTNESWIVTWKPPVNAAADEVESGTIGLVVTNVSPIAFPK